MIEPAKGFYIVIEGAQGTGKTTQIDLLSKRLKNAGYGVRLFREPDAQTDLTAQAIRRLTQDPRYPMNTRTEALLYNAARSQSLEVIKNARDKGVICLCDRNYLSTLALQYYGRGNLPDYEAITSIINFAVGNMQPDITIILDAPSEVLAERAKHRGQGERFDSLSLEFLERVRAGYLIEAQARNYPVLLATEVPEAIHEKIWNFLHGQPIKSAFAAIKQPLPLAIQQDAPKQNKLVTKTKAGWQITEEGRAYLEKIVTNTDKNIYALTENMSSLTAAAAFARLSRRFDDLRITLLDEFSSGTDNQQDLLKRVITAYGDDSVQQLVGQYIVVEGASILLTKKIEWGRLAAYLEQSTRYIYYDQKDDQGNYKYLIPSDLSPKVKKVYKTTMDNIFDKYSQMVHSTTNYVRKHSKTPQKEQDGAWVAATRAQACDAVRAVLPMATKSTVGIFVSGQALENMIIRLNADDLTEAREAGAQILNEARQIIPAFLERADKPDRGGATSVYLANRRETIKKIAKKYLPQNYSNPSDSVTLLEAWPRNELDIVADMLYEHSNMPLTAIQQEVNGWSYAQKEEVFKAYIGERLNRRHKPGRALEKINYHWDIFCEYGVFKDLMRHRIVSDMEWQQLTPRYGYGIPKLVEKAGLSEQFIDCFDLSLELHSLLQKSGYELEAQYATLHGHIMRWKVSFNAREAFHLFELRTSPQGHPNYRKLAKQMHEKVMQVHPLIAESMIFVNKDEDPELNRLAAERYAQHKLKMQK
jgi:dTMP kinase